MFVYLGSSPIFFALIAFSLKLSHPLSKVTVRSFRVLELISFVNLPSNQMLACEKVSESEFVFICRRIKKEFRLVCGHKINNLLTSHSVRMEEYSVSFYFYLTCLACGSVHKQLKRELNQYSPIWTSRSVNN